MRDEHAYTTTSGSTPQEILAQVERLLDMPGGRARAVGVLEVFLGTLRPVTFVQRTCEGCRVDLAPRLDRDRVPGSDPPVLRQEKGLCDACWNKRHDPLTLFPER